MTARGGEGPDEVVFREMRPEDAQAALALRNEVFAAYPVAADWARDQGNRTTTVEGGFRG